MNDAKRTAVEKFAVKIAATIKEAVRRAFESTEARLAALEKRCAELEERL